MDQNLKVAIITGASSGIGKATALLFAKNKYRLSLSGRDEAALAAVVKECILAADYSVKNITTTIGDLRDQTVSKGLVNHTIDNFGQIDVLVNCAGILVTGDVQSSSITDYDRVFDVNVRSVIHLTKLVILHLITTKGAIVNVSSVAGTCSFPDVTYYSMSKAAVDQFTKCLALELAPKGVRVNSVNPGVIGSDLHRRAGMSTDDYDAFLKKCERTHALGRVGSCDEVAEAIYFLASRSASFTTGVLLHIDGGRHLMTPR